MDRRGPAQGCPHCHLAVFVGLATHDDGATDAAFLHEQPDGMFLCGNNGFLVVQNAAHETLIGRANAEIDEDGFLLL